MKNKCSTINRIVNDDVKRNVNVIDLLEKKISMLNSTIYSLNSEMDELKREKIIQKESEYTLKKEIMKLNTEISKIRIKKTVVNNFYEEKTEEIKILNAKEVDSILRKRYKY
jgi:chromosome segregation ATPase